MGKATLGIATITKVAAMIVQGIIAMGKATLGIATLDLRHRGVDGVDRDGKGHFGYCDFLEKDRD